MSKLKVLVCGSRDWTDMDYIRDRLLLLTAMSGDLHVITGTRAPYEGNVGPLKPAHGADQYAHYWAVWSGMPHTIVPADWGKYGVRAGPRRNRQMLDMQPDLVLAFATAVDAHMMPTSRGTYDTVREALRRALRVEVHTGGGRVKGVVA